jgi:hypothetical protein
MALPVADEFRTNPLSLVPGGHTVIVTFRDGSELEYDKIHNVFAYEEVAYLNPEVLSVRVKKPETV